MPGAQSSEPEGGGSWFIFGGSTLSSQLVLPFIPEWAEPVWHLFVIRHPQRDALQKQLMEGGVGTIIHYPVPPHMAGAYGDLKMAQGTLPLAEDLARTVLSLPLGPHLTEVQGRTVVAAVRGGIGL